MADLVRAKDPGSGAEFTCSAEYAEACGAVVLTDKPATDDYGRALDAKSRTDKAGTASAKKE